MNLDEKRVQDWLCLQSIEKLLGLERVILVHLGWVVFEFD
jgi:hypothetical protein